MNLTGSGRGAAVVATAALAALAALALGTVLTGCSSDPGPPELSVRQAYIPLPAADDIAAGYLTVRNDGGTGDRLVKVTSSLTDEVTMHRTSGSGMERVNGFDIPAGGTLRLERGGNHLMFMGLSGKPELGDKVDVELEFAESEPLDVQIPVRELTYRPPDK